MLVYKVAVCDHFGFDGFERDDLVKPEYMDEVNGASGRVARSFVEVF
ncbi:hypothetical protein [Brevibacillus sp. IT-7CA2]